MKWSPTGLLSLSRVRRTLYSVPLFFKIAGVGAVAVAIFGVVMHRQIHNTIEPELQAMLGIDARVIAQNLAVAMERAIWSGDVYRLREQVDRTMEAIPHLRYVVVVDSQDGVLVHSFPDGVPAGLRREMERMREAGETRTMIVTPEGRVTHWRAPVARGSGVWVHAGVIDTPVHERMEAIRWAAVRAIGSGGLLALLAAVALTRLLTDPIGRLIQVAHEIRSGRFDARANLDQKDEVGELGDAIDAMAASLERYRDLVMEKDRQRQKLLERIVMTQEDERKAIARELHDQVGQSLLAILLQLESECSAGICLPERKASIQNQLRDLADEVHRISWGMRPAILDDYGVERAIERYVEMMQRRSGVTMHFEYSGPVDPPRLPSSIAITLYRVAQEAVTNIVRHAEAKYASVILIRKRSEVILVVEDDGRGFDVNGPVESGTDQNLGLVGMRERVTMVGGEFRVSSVPGEGATVRVRVPLEDK